MLPLAQLFDLVRGDQSGIFSDPAPCFISREDETNLTPEERVLVTTTNRLPQTMTNSKS